MNSSQGRSRWSWAVKVAVMLARTATTTHIMAALDQVDHRSHVLNYI